MRWCYWWCYLWCRYGPCDPAHLQERMKSAIATLGEDEVHDILRTEGKLEVSFACFQGRARGM